jgi:hypothetical protein
MNNFVTKQYNVEQLSFDKEFSLQEAAPTVMTFTYLYTRTQ